MEITLDLIKELRNKTGAGINDCKKALEESDGNIEKAVEILRKKGAAMALKRADKIANEGAIKSAIAEDQKTGVMIEVNCETDFVSKGDEIATVNPLIESRVKSIDVAIEAASIPRTGFKRAGAQGAVRIGAPGIHNLIARAIRRAGRNLMMEHCHSAKEAASSAAIRVDAIGNKRGVSDAVGLALFILFQFGDWQSYRLHGAVGIARHSCRPGRAFRRVKEIGRIPRPACHRNFRCDAESRSALKAVVTVRQVVAHAFRDIEMGSGAAVG